MAGAASLAGTAALRGGAGLVVVATPRSVGSIVATAQPCYMTAEMPADRAGRFSRSALSPLVALAESATAVVVGPGLGQSPALVELIVGLLEQIRRPLVLDADALNALAGRTAALQRRPAPTLLTPHPGEFARLLGSDTRRVQADRVELTVQFARQHGVVLVLKGAGTVVSDGQRVYVNTTGNPGMATGGSGDVLTGLLGALLAQGMLPFEAAVLGVFVHGRAGDLARDAVGEVSLIASDLLDNLPAAFSQ